MNKRGRKYDKVEIRQRIRAVQEWILQGQFSRDIIANVVQKWGVAERTAYHVYAQAWKGIQDADNENLKEKTAYHVQLRKDLYKKLKDKNLPSGARAALQIADSLALIEGVIARNNLESRNAEKETKDETVKMKLPDGTEIEI